MPSYIFDLFFKGSYLKGVFLDSGIVDPTGVGFSRLKSLLSEWTYFNQTQSEQVLSRIKDVDIIVVNKVVLNKDILSKTTKLKCICVTATGVDNIDVEYAQQKGIVICNVNNYATASVAQHTFALIFSLVNRIPEYHMAVQQGQWSGAPGFCLPLFSTFELAGKTMGVIGRGQSGQAVANIANVLGMKVLFSERKNIPQAKVRPGYVPFSEVIENADVISLNCPLNRETQHLLARAEFKKMKSTALLINVARGRIIDEEALAWALAEKEIAGAGLDVLSQEPPPKDNILLCCGLPNIIITPHVAWNTFEGTQRLIDESISNIECYLQGRPTNVVKST